MRWISVINLIVIGMILFTLSLFIFSDNEEKYVPIAVQPEQKELPKSPFADSDEFFQEIGENLFTLAWIPPKMQLPDLRQELLFYGKNARPDCIPGKTTYYFSLKGSQERALVKEGERRYLVYQGNYSPKIFNLDLIREPLSTSPRPIWGEVTESTSTEKTSYVLSPGNQPTPLWFEAKSTGDQSVEIRVSMLDEKGALVISPSDLRTFPLQVQDFSKPQMTGWEIGGQRVDTTLLVRQKARWLGPDLFLAYHGGDEFAHVIGKERIDFLDGPTPYSCFVSAQDFLVWKEGRWEVAQTLEASQHLPLMVVKKVDEKVMTFELWDPEGRSKTLLSLIRSKDHNGMPNVNQEFKFVGAKTWAQFIVECRTGGRMTLKPHDWLVLTQNGWIKLDSSDQIDDFVNQVLCGPLFILDKITKQNGRQALVGHLFSTSRTEMEQVELTSSPPMPLANFYRHLPVVPPIQPQTIEGE